MRVGIYVRVSTRDQNCAMQLRDLRAYCTARQPDVVREYVFDAGQSGTKDSRPELSELMSAVHRRKPDAVIVWRLTDLPVRRDTFLPRWKSSALFVSGSFRTRRRSTPASDEVIAGRTDQWRPMAAEAHDIGWLNGRNIDPHKKALAHIISCYIHTGCLNREIR